MGTRPSKEEILTPVKEIIAALVAGDIDRLEKVGALGRNRPEEIAAAIEEYGRTLASVPEDAWEELVWMIPIQGERAWVVDVDLWTEEEGHSDLTLCLRVREEDDELRAHIQSLHVL